MKRRFTIFGDLVAFALFWGMMAGCEADDTPGGSSSGEVVPVTISLQMDAVDQLTKAVDENTINTLDVYIYNGITVEKHLTKADFGDDLRAETDLSEGTKTIYAIANAGNPYGETAPANTGVNALHWLDAQPDAYMPMSTTNDTTWTVSSSQAAYEVRLNRMVAKMNVKIEDERSDKANTVSEVTIFGLKAGTTNLYRKGYGEVLLPAAVATSAWTWRTPVFSSAAANSGDFYLHENSGTFPVSVQVGDDTRNGSFTMTIPRNHIFPLVIHLTDYSLDIKVEYQLAAIGTLPVTKNLSTYSFILPEGCTYMVTVTPKKNMADGAWAASATWTWTVPTNLGSGNLKVDSNPSWPNGKTVTGTADAFSFRGSVVSLPTVEEYKIPIVLNDGDVTMNFDLVIKTRPLGDGELTRSCSVSAETEAVHIDL